MRHTLSPALLCRGAVAALASIAVVAASAPAVADDGSTGPENVILLIGDGMGYRHIDATSLYERGQANWQVRTGSDGIVRHVPGRPTQVFETWDHVAMTTFSDGGSYDPDLAWTDFAYVRDRPTDSAAASTAMATGVKTYDAGIGVDPDGNPVENVTERAIALGKSAGTVTSVPFSHATPAGYYAHEESRNSYHAIADDGLRSQLSVIMGAGHPFYDDSGDMLAEPNYRYLTEESYDRLVAGDTNFTLVDELDGFQALTEGETPDRVFGLARTASTLQQGRGAADTEEAQPYVTPFNSGVPTLETMTRGALNVLDDDEDGFFLMVEGGAIDWASHDGQTARVIEETQDFNASVEAVVEWVETNSSWAETMVVVTADHETGYLGGPGEEPAWTLMTASAGRQPGVGWSHDQHTNQLAPLFVRGAGAEALVGRATGTDSVRGRYLDNTDLADVLLDDLWASTDPGDGDGDGDGAEGDVPVAADIPQLGDGDGPPAALVLSVAPGTAELGAARNAGDRLRLSGLMPTVSVSDSRPEAAGWSVTGRSSALASDAGEVAPAQLGWAPFLVEGVARPGAKVEPALSGGPGLAAPATLGTSVAESRVGTAALAADLALEVPIGTRAGTYTGAITLSLFPQD